jgi:hypothetical protein
VLLRVLERVEESLHVVEERIRICPYGPQPQLRLRRTERRLHCPERRLGLHRPERRLIRLRLRGGGLRLIELRLLRGAGLCQPIDLLLYRGDLLFYLPVLDGLVVVLVGPFVLAAVFAVRLRDVAAQAEIGKQ